MSKLNDWITDTNGDGYSDDVGIRFLLDLPGRSAGLDLWRPLLDLAARIGLETHALPMPLVLADAEHDTDPNVERVVIRSASEVTSILDGEAHDIELRTEDAVASEIESPVECLTYLFTKSGALEDRDGDFLPDASRIQFDLPESLPAALGASIANLAARIGLETGGVTLPLAGDSTGHDGPAFVVRESDRPASLRVTESGWLAEGEAGELARLLNRVASEWPHLDAPETGGVSTAIGNLRHWLAGHGPEAPEPGDVVWSRDWTDDWEVERLLSTFLEDSSRLSNELRSSEQVTVVAFASEPPEHRRQLEERMQIGLSSAGVNNASVTVLSAFKVGLSWLREVVIPEASRLPVSRVHISYQRYNAEDPDRALDMPIRWLQELFPGTELIANELGIPEDSIQLDEHDADSEPTFIAEAFDESGASLARWTCSPHSELQPFVAALGEEAGEVLVTSAGYSINADGRTLVSTAVPSDLQAFWAFWQQDVIPSLFNQIEDGGGPHVALQPFFSELVAEVWISEPNELLGVREENDSAAEALAEDIYFTTLDAIALYGSKKVDESPGAPGQIIPKIHVTPGEAPRARVTLRAAPDKRDLPVPEVRVERLYLDGDEFAVDVSISVDRDEDATGHRLEELSSLFKPAERSISASVELAGGAYSLDLPLPELLEHRGEPSAGSDAAEVAQPSSPPPMDENIHGDAVIDIARSLSVYPEITSWIEGYSYQGRPLVAMSISSPTPGRLHSPTKAAIFKPTHLIVARHHANEISSTNAAFQLAWLCANDEEWRWYVDSVNIVLIPYENPDGAALHAELSSMTGAAKWKHHPARYNALGFEFGEAHFDPDTRFGEARVRSALWGRWPADVVVDNHGVPSHEWIQPFAGFGSPPRFRVSYWILQALLYGIIWHVDNDEFPEHRAAAMALRDAVSKAVRDTDIGEWNRTYGASYRFWGQSRLPDHFPGEFYEDMLWHISGREPDPGGRGFNSRYPKTTVLSWVTEVGDETVEGAELERVARAHLTANRATLELLAISAPSLGHQTWRNANDQRTVQIGRNRPLQIVTHPKSSGLE